MTDQLSQVFQKVKRCYFPRWDRKNEWRIRRGLPDILKEDYREDSFCGYCNSDTKTIWLLPLQLPNGMNLASSIAHEICHAVADQAHGKRWRARYLAVAEKATAIGQTEVAEAINMELSSMRDTIVNARTLAAAVSDAVFDAPTESFESILRWVANEDTVFKPEALLRKYPSLKRAYDQDQTQHWAFEEAKNELKSTKRTVTR